MIKMKEPLKPSLNTRMFYTAGHHQAVISLMRVLFSLLPQSDGVPFYCSRVPGKIRCLIERHD